MDFSNSISALIFIGSVIFIVHFHKKTIEAEEMRKGKAQFTALQLSSLKASEFFFSSLGLNRSKSFIIYIGEDQKVNLS